MKKLTALLLTGALAISVLTGCGNTTDTKDQAATDAATDATDEATDAADASDATDASDAEATDDASDAAVESKGTITVAASATPHAEILEEAKPILAEQGWDLEVTVFDDYVQPNLVVESGEFDANYFQHIPYLDEFQCRAGNTPRKCRRYPLRAIRYLSGNKVKS